MEQEYILTQPESVNMTDSVAVLNSEFFDQHILADGKMTIEIDTTKRDREQGIRVVLTLVRETKDRLALQVDSEKDSQVTTQFFEVFTHKRKKLLARVSSAVDCVIIGGKRIGLKYLVLDKPPASLRNLGVTHTASNTSQAGSEEFQIPKQGELNFG